MATPFGRYKWLRLPFGVSPAPELFQGKLDEALLGLEWVLSIADDTLVVGEGDMLKEAICNREQRMVKMLQRCRERNLKLNPERMIFRRQEVLFVCHILTSNGLKMQPARGTAIADMNTPEDVAAVRRFLGMANYV